MSWLDKIASRAGVERDWNTGVSNSTQTSAPADDSAWKYISAGDIKGLADYTNREYNYHNIPYIGQGIGHTANNTTMGLANLAQFLGADSVSNYLYEKGKEGEAQLPDYRTPELSLSYALDPNGLLSAGAMVAGSMLSMAPVAALAPVGGIAAGAARLAGNVPKVGGLLSNFAPGAVRWATTGPIEAMMEGGGTEREMLENGASREAANAAAWDVFKKNAALLTATNALEGGLLGKLGVKTPTFKNPVANGISRAAAYAPQTAAEAVLQGYEEGAQEGIQAAAMGNGANTAAQILNPSNWTEGQWDAAKMGFAGGLPLVGGMAIARRLGNRMSRPSSDAPMKSSGNENTDALIAQAAEKYGVPVNLLHSIAQTESEYNQDARSEAGAIGMMQLMPDTAAGLGVDPNDLAGNIEGGAKYMRELLDTFDGDLEKAVAAYNAGPNAVKKHGGIPPYAQTQDYVRKVLGGLDGYDTSVSQRMRNLADDAAPYIGVTMDNGENGCVEAVTKIGAKSCPFLAQELSNGVVNVDRLVEDAGENVIPFDPNQLEEGDVIVYGDASDPQRHVVLYDGKGGYIGNSTEQNKVVQGEDYNQMGDWTPTKIIKTGAQFSGAGAHSLATPVMPDFTGLIADETNIKETQEAIQKLINADNLSPAQHAAILQAAEMVRDMPVGDGTDPALEAEHVNEWQQLIDRKDAKGIFEKDPKRIVQTMTKLGKEQRAQKTRAAIENQQKIEETKQALAALTTQAQPVQSGVTPPTVQQIVPEQDAPMGLSTPAETVMQNPQIMQDGTQVMPTNVPVQDAVSAPVPNRNEAAPQMNAAPTPSGAAQVGMERGAPQNAQQPSPRVSQEELSDILSKVQEWENPLLSIPEYVAARNRQDWNAAALIARAAGIHGVAQFYNTLMEHGSRTARNVTSYAPQQETPHAAAEPMKAPVPVVGVRPNVPTRLPDNLEERRKLGRALGRFMLANGIPDSPILRDNLAMGRGKAIKAANDRISAWEEKRAEQEARAAQYEVVNARQTAQEDAQGAQNVVDDRILAQHGEHAQNAYQTVRGKSAQKQGNKKAADEGGIELADGYETESGRPLSAADPKEFIIKPNGSRNFGEITKAVSDAVMEQSGEKLPMGEIRLRVGNSSEGLIHAKEHEDQARTAGYDSIESLIADVAENFDRIYMRNPVYEGQKPTYSLVKSGNKSTGVMNGVAPIYFELQTDGSGNYYIVISAMPKGDKTLSKQTKKDRLIYSSPGLGAATESNTGAVSASAKNVGAESRGGSPTSDKSGGSSTSTIPSEAEESKENNLNDNEREAVKGLSADAKNVYQMIRDKLAETKNKKIARAASVGAALFARHADIIARKVRAALGKPFTAMDYYRTWFDLRYGGEESGFTQAAMKKSDATSLSEFSRQMRTPEAGSGSRKKTFLRITAPSGAFVDVAQDDMIHMHHHHPEMTDEDFSIIQENMEKFLRVHQDKTGKGDYGGETVLCKIKTPRGVAGVSYELLPMGRIFLKTAFFDNENGIDNWIAKNGTSKDLMYADTEKRGNAASMLTGHPSRPADAADSLTPSVAQPLSLFMIQERIGIVNGEKFNQSAWHGTPHDFDGFDLGAIGTGEGAQVHGWGLYFAQNREVSQGYRERLKKIGLFYDGKEKKELSSDIQEALDSVFKGEELFIHDKAEARKRFGQALVEMQKNVDKARDSLAQNEEHTRLAKQNPNMSVPELLKKMGVIESVEEVSSEEVSSEELSYDNMLKELEAMKTSSEKELREYQRAYRLLQKIDPEKIEMSKPGSLFEVEIPDDDVLLDEQKALKDQPKIVELLDKYAEKIDDWTFTLDEMDEGITGGEFYKWISELEKDLGAQNGDKVASEYLNAAGIKGITYDGRRDGRCFVVFDDKAISIIEKFNQQMNEIVKGTTQDVRDGQRIVSLFAEADESTFLHEMGHLFLLDLERLADMSPTSAEELQTVRKWAAWSEGQAAEYKRTPFEAEFADLDAKIRAALKKGDEKTANKLKRQWEHERFARGFERYLQYGEAPTKGLRAVFAKFRAFLQRVYQAFTGTGGRATPEVEAIMARMISIEDSSDLSAYPQGKKTAVYTDSGKKIPVQYRVVSADDLIASHDAGALEVNPGYPTALQPRDRERVMMREQVTRMANTLRPEDLADGRNLNQGAPLIRSDGVVLNGNGRTIAIQRAQARNKDRALAYKDYLVENAATFGLSKEDVEGVKNPALVREVQGDISDELMQDIIGSTTGGARMGASEAAHADAEKVTYAMLDTYVPNDKGDLTTAANRSFVAGILHKLVGKDEMNAYLDKDGYPNADGIQRVKRALFALAYGDDELIAKMAESTDDDIRNVSNGLMTAAPMVARLSVKQGAPYVKELQDAIGAAVKQLDSLRRSGQSVKDYLGAQALFAEHEDSAEMRAILSFLDENKRSGKRIATFFSRAATTLDEMETPSGNELFDAEMPALMDVLEEAKKYAVSGGQEGLFEDNVQDVAAIKNALTNLARAAWNDKTAQGKVSFAPSRKLRDKVQELFGHDIDEVFITADDMRHIKKHHSEYEEKRGQVSLTPESITDVYDVVNDFDEATLEQSDAAGNQKMMIVKDLDGRTFVLLVERGKSKAEVKTVYKYKKPSPMSDVTSPEPNVRNDSAKVSSTSNISPNEAEGKEKEPTLEDILRLAPSLQKAALEYGAKDENGKVTFADKTRKQEFLKVAKALLSAGERKFSKAWHGSPHDFDAFDLGAIGTGEGAQAHGYGLYFAKAKKTAASYRGRLSSKNELEIVYDGKKSEELTGEIKAAIQLLHLQGFRPEDNLGKFIKTRVKDYTEMIRRWENRIREIDNTLSTNAAQADQAQLYEERKNNVDRVAASKNVVRQLKLIDTKKAVVKGAGSLFHVEIPDNDVLLDEHKSYAKQPLKVREALEKLVRGLTLDQLENWNDVRRLGKSKVIAEIMDALSESNGMNIYGTISDLVEGQKEASVLLNQYGIKGITYGGQEDGRCYVIFDDKAIKILEKFSARRQEALQKMLDGIRLIPPTRVSPRKRVLVDWGCEMGVSVVFFKGDPSLHGFHQDGVTFLNVDSEITPQWTFWHEAMHWMKVNNPDIYNELVQTISGADGFTKEQLDAYRKEIGAPHVSDADVIEEMLADALPDVRRRVPLLRDVGKRDTGLVQRVVAWIRDVMRRFHDRFNTPKGGLTNDQRRAMIRAFGNLVGSLRDADGKPIFRIENEGARITLRGGKPLPAVRYSLDNRGKEGDNESEVRLTSSQKDKVCANVLARMKKRVHDMLQQGVTWEEIQKELDDENSTSREEALRVFKTQWNIFNSPRVNKRNVVERITKNQNFTDDEINELFDQYKAKMKEMLDYGGFIYKEAAFQQRGNRRFLAGVHSWRELERANARHGGSAHTGHKNSLNTKHLESQGAFSMPASKESMRWIATHPFKYDESQTMDENIQRAESLAQEYLDTFGTTDKINTPARQKLRREIADKLYGKGAKKKEGRAWLVLGLPASGKSTIADPLVEREGALLIDSDEAKKLLPEFSNGLLAGAVHEESANIADEVMIEALSKGDNVVLPIVGKTLSSLNEKRKKLEDAGYEVNLVYVDLPIEKAIERTKTRFRHTGRLVSPRYLQSVGLKPRQNYDKIKTEKGVGSYEAWDNDILRGETPRLIERSARPEQKAPRRWMGGRGQHARSLDEGNGLGYRNATGTGSNSLKDNNENRSDNRGGFSMPKFSANTSGESPKGNFKLLKDRIRSLVGVAPADNLELPGRVQRTVTLSPKDLEKRIRERWIQEKNIISQEKQPDGKIKVTYYPDTHDVGYADYVKSVRQVAKRNPFVKVLYDLAHKAMKKQEKLRNEFGKALKEFNDLVKNEKDLKSITAILWQGDAEGRAYTNAELRAMGANERVIKAYRLVRRELEKAYKMLRDAQTQVKTRSQTLDPESVETFKKSHWIEDADVISTTPRADGTVLLTWRGGRTYDVKGKTMTAAELKLMQEDENINVTASIPKGDGTFSVSYVERIKPVFRRTGYMPHFFHEWMIYEKYKDPKTGEERYTSVASGRTMNEAVKIGNEIAKDNADKQYVLRPKGFDLGAENAVVIGDMDFAQMSQKLAESTEISLADARSLLLEDAGASLKSRHRFFGSLLERKDGKGFDQDVQWVLAHYFNSAARYIAMEDFKPAAISMYERFFGRFDDEPKNLTAQYCKNLINDVNGNPRGVEVWLNDLLKKTWIGKHIADSYGDRVALAVNGELSTWNAITKLGLFNFASMAVNFSQFINVGAALNDYGYAAKGLKRALNPSALDEKIIEASGLLDDINMLADNGGYTQRRGGKVRGIYSGIKKGGEWTLILFQKADMLMRKAAVLGAYYQGVEQKGMKTAPGDELSAEALAYAQDINDDANFDYSSANAPGMFRAGSVVTQQLFQFQKYPIMQFEFMYNIMKNGTRGQKVRMFVPYVLFCGMCGSLPFGGLFNQLFSFLFGLATGDDEDIAQEVKAEVLRWAGKDPVKKAIAETALYGVLAPTFGLDISGRIGMSNAFGGEFYGAQKPESVAGVIGQQLGGPAANSIYNMFHQFHEGNNIEALKAVSPALGNMAQAAVGESRTTRHRVNARYDTAYDKIAHALGFRSVEESKNAFIMHYEYEQKGKAAQIKREAIQDYIADPSDENRRTINALGITERQIKEARIQQERTALERAREGRPKTSSKSGASRRRKEEAQQDTLYDTLDDE